ncbi:MAG: T9SS type A sorting domain-containing protein, partial [Ignavibacteriae bacterium]|nr:T9SS type A sorting domain-containing protein [Ignavibacteriota bacterium]
NLPTDTKLEANFPNPFNPVTEIKYSLHQDAQVSLIVYDVLGREVQTLINGFEDAGYKSVQFDASSLSSGVYFYRLSTGYYTNVKRMILMK